MALAMNSLRPCKLHCQPFGIMTSQAFHFISTKPSVQRTRIGDYLLQLLSHASLYQSHEGIETA